MKNAGSLPLVKKECVFSGILNIYQVDNQITFSDQMGFLFDINDAKEMIELLNNYISAFSQSEIDKHNHNLLSQYYPPSGSRHKSAATQKPPPKEGYIYFLSDGNGNVKIGKTVDIKKRIESMKLPEQPILLHAIHVKDYDKAEIIFHEHYKEYRKRGEWFELPQVEIETIQNGIYPKEISKLLVEINNEKEHNASS